MLLSVFDPALLIYKYEDWQSRKPYCLDCFEALTLHRRMIREYGQKMALSDAFVGLIYQFFPWNQNYSHISELRDLRQFILQDLQRGHYIAPKIALEIDLQPSEIVCEHVEDSGVIDTWKELLCGCVDEAVLSTFAPQIATWETDSLRKHSGPIILTIYESEAKSGTQVHYLPFVWDDESWATQLVTQEWWPDLHRCVELYFRTNRAMRDYSGVREQPIPFECSGIFWKSLDRFCREKHLRDSLIEALTKRVYGIFDASLGDEPFRKIRRFRVTDFWRVHYREKNGRLMLEEFGPHSIGRVN